MMTRIGRLVLISCGLFYLIGSINQSDAAFIFCWSGLSILVACFLLSRASLSGVEMTFECPTRDNFEGKESVIRLHVRNRGSLNKMNIRLSTPLANVTQGLIYAPRYNVDFIQSKDELDVDVPLRGLPRGLYRIPEVRMAGGDPLGLYCVSRRIRTGVSFLIYPHVYTVRGGMHPSGDSESPKSPPDLSWRQSEAGIDFFGVRDYHPGDDLRRIHWPATARRGKLVLRELESAVHGSVSVWVDLWSQQVVGTGGDASLEWQLRIAASLIYDCLSASRMVSLVCTSTPPAIMRAGRGNVHLKKALEILALANANGEYPLHEVLSRLPGECRGSRVAIITGDVGNVGLAVSVLRRGGADCTVLLLDPTTFADGSREDGSVSSAENAARQLRHSGAEVIVFRRGEDVTGLLTLLGHREKETELGKAAALRM